MKQTVFAFFFVTLSALAYPQENKASLKKEIVGIDVGLFGGWINYERHIGGLFSLKSELGLEGGFAYGQSLFLDAYSYYYFTPSIRLEPRYYYGFNRRVRLGKKTSYNASNYVGLTATCIPSLFTISNYSHVVAEKTIDLIAKWGINRTIGRKVNFEFAIGLGARNYFGINEAEAIIGLDLRFGYILW